MGNRSMGAELYSMSAWKMSPAARHRIHDLVLGITLASKTMVSLGASEDQVSAEACHRPRSTVTSVLQR